jgi:ribosomal protein L2
MLIQSIFNSTNSFYGDLCILKFMAEGSIIHNLEKIPFYGSSYSRAAGTFSILVKKYIHINKCVVKLKSGEFKLLALDCHAIVGKVSNF